MNLCKNYGLNLNSFKAEFKDCSDFLLREVVIGGKRAFFMAMDGLIDSLQLNRMIIAPVLSCKLEDSAEKSFETIKNSVVGAIEMSVVYTFEECEFYVMSGFAVFMLEGCGKALVMAAQGWSRRTTDEPTNEAMVKGAKECFVETLNDNKALLRKRLKTPHLKLKQLRLGTAAQTQVVLAYIDNRAKKGFVEEIEKRLEKAELNTVLDYGCLEPYIGSDVKSVFSAVGNTERPDVLASKLLEGRVGVMVEGTPFVMFVPNLFSDNFSSLDDYDNPPFYASFVRFLKYLSFVISVFLPAMYVAIGAHHQEMIPSTLLYIVATSEETTPFPLVAEAVIIHILYEIMREAGLRLPKPIGHAISIIGAIVIGEAMVTAGIIGEPMLVVVALTAISSYVVYPLYESVALLRIVFILLAGITGIYGLMLGVGVLFVNACAINPFGVPFTAPLSPLTKETLGDTLVRSGWEKLSKRRVRVYDFEGAELDEKQS